MLKAHPRIVETLKKKLQFGFSSILATGLDYSAFILLVRAEINAVSAHAISASIGMLVNFFVQNNFVFNRQRNVWSAFVMSMGISFIGVGLSSICLSALLRINWLGAHPILAKMVVTLLLFFYNFYLKRYSFEKRFF